MEVYTHKFGVCWGFANDGGRAERRGGGCGASFGVAVDESEEGGSVALNGEAAEREQREQSQEDVRHTTGEGIAISDSPALPPPPTSTTTWLTPGRGDADVEDLQRNSPPGAQLNAAVGFISDTITTNASSPNDVHALPPYIPDPLTSTTNLGPNPVALMITSHTSGLGFVFQFTLSYGEAVRLRVCACGVHYGWNCEEG